MLRLPTRIRLVAGWLAGWLDPFLGQKRTGRDELESEPPPTSMKEMNGIFLDGYKNPLSLRARSSPTFISIFRATTLLLLVVFMSGKM